jgi:hypothetical protein
VVGAHTTEVLDAEGRITDPVLIGSDDTGIKGPILVHEVDVPEVLVANLT